MRRLRTTACGKFETLEKYVFEHGEQDATSPEFSAGPLHPKKCISSPYEEEIKHVLKHYSNLPSCSLEHLQKRNTSMEYHIQMHSHLTNLIIYI